MENKEIAVIETGTPATEPEQQLEPQGNPYLLRFNKPYTFEEETFTEIDLSGLEDITAADMIATQKMMSRGGTVDMLPEMSVQYACIIAARISGKPVEFFTGLPAKEAMKLKNMVSGFIYGAD